MRGGSLRLVWRAHLGREPSRGSHCSPRVPRRLCVCLQKMLSISAGEGRTARGEDPSETLASGPPAPPPHFLVRKMVVSTEAGVCGGSGWTGAGGCRELSCSGPLPDPGPLQVCGFKCCGGALAARIGRRNRQQG